VELDKDALMNMVLPLQEEDVAATNAVVLTKVRIGVMRLFQYVEYYYNNLIRVSFSKLFDNSIWFFGAVACYKRSALDKIGGFKKDTLTEDMDVCLELYRHGYRIITLKEARIYTDALSFFDFLNQRMRWYFGALQGLYKNRKLFRNNIRSVPVVFLFLNQYWWTFYAIISIPIIVYQVIYWWPSVGVFGYLFRWFSLAGPVYVLYKIPDGWLSFLNISGISAGLLTAIMIIISFIFLRKRLPLKSILPMFFYFPFTIVLNLAILFSLLKYLVFRKKSRYFIG
jgi:cellulose synthase/poly-beta-1,6-N-acetylglucosamine synthase-like glycosyltransferase